MRRQLTKSPNNVVITGTLAGIAEWLGVDPTIVRVIYAIACFIFAGSPIVLYFVLALIIPSGKNGGNRHYNSYNRNTRNANPYANPSSQKQRKQAEKVDDDDWSDF